MNGVANGLGHVNGDGKPPSPRHTTPGLKLTTTTGENVHTSADFRALEETNERLKQELETAKADNEDLNKLVGDYSGVLEKVLEGLRVYAVRLSLPSLPPVLTMWDWGIA